MHRGGRCWCTRLEVLVHLEEVLVHHELVHHEVLHSILTCWLLHPSGTTRPARGPDPPTLRPSDKSCTRLFCKPTSAEKALASSAEVNCPFRGWKTAVCALELRCSRVEGGRVYSQDFYPFYLFKSVEKDETVSNLWQLSCCSLPWLL